MLYGYAQKTLSDEGLLEMRDVTIVAWPQTLREIAQFLLATADEMEGTISKHFHRHITSREWDERFPGKDLIVAVPEDFPAKPPPFCAE